MKIAEKYTPDNFPALMAFSFRWEDTKWHDITISAASFPAKVTSLEITQNFNSITNLKALSYRTD